MPYLSYGFLSAFIYIALAECSVRIAMRTSTICFTAFLKLCEHRIRTVDQLNHLFEKYEEFLCQSSYHKYATQGEISPHMDFYRHSRRVTDTSVYRVIISFPAYSPCYIAIVTVS
jgi:hypothetical protein